MRFGPQRFMLGDFSSDAGQIGVDLGEGNISQAFSDNIMGLPAWTWLAGLGFAYLFLFGGGEEHSRFGRARRATRKGLASAKAAY